MGMLDEKVLQELRDAQARLNMEGKLPSRTQLTAYYDTFRRRFGPERLSSLDGEALLETMHDHSSSNRDSLVYWLEFKDDDEFPAFFGSIAGGSALKFGIYRRKETGAWMTGSSRNQQELSVPEAIEVARRHRDQFLRGAELLEALPANATDADYARLQEDMDRLAPNVSNSAWGHKYFSLLYPDKLENYHVTSYQQFHLIKLLLEPPPGDGRYVAAARYVAIAQLLGVPLNPLAVILNELHGEPHRYWRIGTKLYATDSRWEYMRENGCVAVGWAAFGDLSHLSYDTASKEEIRSLMQQHYPNAPQAVGRATQQVFNFVTVIREGDLVLPADGQRILGIGRVTDRYLFDASSDVPHQRPVEWLSWEEWQFPTREGLQTTVHEIRRYPENLIETERRVLYATPLAPVVKPGPKEPGLHRPARLSGIPGRVQAVLERKKQVILYGPPGTGKTYWARAAALDLASYAAFGEPFDKLGDDQRKVIVGDKETKGLVQMCTFHPAYGYEDFLEGYRPHHSDSQLLFRLRDGIFKHLCDTASQQPGRRFYLIIDEINRGDIPRIFGELLTILEKDKRGQLTELPLSGESFSVPEDLYVIGTMNTADRSIALLDTALRRRFGFIELMPDSSVLGDTIIDNSIPLGPWLDALNSRLLEHIGRDARNLQIGHAYFLDGGKPVADLAKFVRILQDDILPLLEEYCYEDYATLEKVLGKGLVDEVHQRVRHELFVPARRDELIQALLAPCPEIVTSSQAVASEVEVVEDLDDENEPDGDQHTT
jgi:5-methylcytosine-specific restriction protein B